MQRIIVVITMAIALMLSGCGGKTPTKSESGESETNAASETVSMEDVKEGAAEAVGAAVELADQTQAEYVKQLKSEITDVGERLDALRAQTKTLGAQARQAWEDRIGQLAEKQEALKERLADVTESTGSAWQELARGMSQARKDMAQALRKAEAEFKDQSSETMKNTPSGEKDTAS